MISTDLIRLRFRFGVYLLSVLAGIVCVQAFSNIVRLDNRYNIILALVTLSLVTFWALRHVVRERGSRKIVLEVTSFLVICYISLNFMGDFSWDGKHYHLPSTVLLANGWNPFYSETGDLLTDHYPHGVWLLRARVATLTGSIESGRIIDCLLLLSALYIISYAVLRNQRSAIYKEECFLILLLCLSPVVVAELPTNCVDGALASVFLCLVGCLLVSEGREEGALLGTISACVILINTKMTGIYFAFLAIAIAVSAGVLRARFRLEWLKQHAGRILIMSLASIASVVVIGFRPYVTNIVNHGVLLYPPVKKIIGGYVPEYLEKANNLVMIAYAVFGETGGDKSGVALKWPWQIHYSELANSDGFAEVGGFGPLFGIVAILGVCLFIAGLWRKGVAKVNKELSFAGLAIILLCLCFPDPWRARFIPMFPAAIGMLVLGVAMRLPRGLLQVFAFVMFLNITPFIAKAVWNGYTVESRKSQSLEAIKSVVGAKAIRISADPEGGWIQHYYRRILEEKGLKTEFGNCGEHDQVLKFFEPVPVICISNG